MIAYVGIGANLGDARANVQDAIARLSRLPHTRLLAASASYRTAPIDSSGPDYINAVACLDTELDPHALLGALQGIEQAHGRERPYRNAPRTLDLDLLLYGTEIVDTPGLTLPHPRMLDRAFVLVPLLEIAADVTVPGQGPARDRLPAVADQPIERLTQ
jgi:2-amino-4-hydroxy-6-hydroxymethyldihydropteridine diphosphokinase